MFVLSFDFKFFVCYKLNKEFTKEINNKLKCQCKYNGYKMLSVKKKIIVSPERSKLMARVRQSGTSAELAFRKIFNELGLHYRTKADDLPGTPDIVNRKRKWAIFVHGCFWHAHRGCKKSKLPKSNRDFWKKKFDDNRRRDKDKIKQLEQKGFSVLVVWECELGNKEELKEKIKKFFKFKDAIRFLEKKNELISSDSDSIMNNGELRVLYKFSNSGMYVSRTVLNANDAKTVTRFRVSENGFNCEDAYSAFDYSYLRRKRKDQSHRNLPIIRGVDIFCGCGGLSLGAREACIALGKRFVTACAVDLNFDFLEVYKNNFDCEKTFLCDINNLIDGEIGSAITNNEHAFIERFQKVDILLAGPPCQGYSDLNNYTRRKDSRNKLYERVARFVEIAEPRHILIENVPTVIHGREKAVQNTLDVLAKLGYNTSIGMINLAEIGVPQQRKRHILIASKNKKVDLDDTVNKFGVNTNRSVGWAISDLESEQPNEVFNTPPISSTTNKFRMNYLHEKNIYELPNRLRPECHKDDRHSYKSMYGRLRYDEPAQTITSGFGSPGQGRFVHPSQPRTLTPREAARLQFFPDFFDFSKVKKRTALAEMIGNAVPMKLSYILCLELFG